MILGLKPDYVAPTTPPTNSILIPIWGQSNANGFYQTLTQLPNYLRGALTRVKIWNYSLVSPAFESLEVGINNNLDELINFPYTVSQLPYPYFGMEMSLGYKMSEYFNTTVYIMKMAIQATSLNSNWKPSLNSLYTSFKNRVLAAKTAMENDGKTVVIPAMISFQGESDGSTSGAASAYGTNRQAFFDQFKTDLSLPTLHDIFFRIVPGINGVNFPYASTVYSAQTTYGQSDPTYIHMISSNSYATSDGIHLNGYSQVAAGTEVFNILKTLYS